MLILTREKMVWLVNIWAILAALIFLVPNAFGSDILYVVGRNHLRPSDRVVVHHLEKRGFKVDIKTDEEVECQDANTKDLIIISESVLAIQLGPKFCDVAVPIICSEPWLFDDFGMTGGETFADYGRKKRQKNIVVFDTQHPLTAALSGEVEVSSKCFYMGWGNPGKNAIRIAELEQDHDKCPIFAYESGVAMPGQIAPARRVGFFMFKNSAKTFTEQGWALYDAVVDWAVGKNNKDIQAMPS